MSPDTRQPSDAPAHCSHPWLRVTCGVCGAAVDELREDPALPGPAPGVPSAPPAPASREPQKLFVVARGHPELVEQLRALLGDSPSIQVIEDRRQVSRSSEPPSGEPLPVRAELRRRVVDDGAPENG